MEMSLTFWKPSARVFNRLLMLHSPILRCRATSSYTSRLGVKHSSRKGGQGALCGARAPQFWGTSLRCWQYGSTRCGRRYSATSQLAAVQAAEPTDHQGETETVLLDVSNMKCGGCSASVKRILLSKPGIEQAAVNLLTESAVVKLRPGQSSAAEAADLLTSKGFPAKVRTSEEGMQDSAEASEQRKREELQRSLWDLSLSWGLVLVCCTHHLGHWLHGLGWHGLAHGPVLNALANPSVSLVLGSVALLGPGRPLIQDGLVSLARGNPNMNSLIGLGALTSFAAGVAAPLVPGMAFDASFLEEPVMLLAFVLLGRTLEARARLKASADLRSLAKLIPADTRLVIDAGTAPGAAAAAKAAEGKGDAALVVMSVPTTSVRAGDVLRVLPGERVPVDGEILEGRCSVDESMLTGEAALVVKAQGSLVTAGTVVFEAPITVRASSTGAGSMLAGIGRLVAAAQAREAPVQRLADTIAGRFCFSVMAASAATFAFWSTLGASLFPSALDSVAGGGALLLGTKLAIDVLVVACPCALGLATPTAVLVASSMGAKRGLLLRGGDVLERIAQVDTVVFDKTGTLTEGRLRLEASSPAEGVSKTELLRWAAAAESSARHPLAAAVLAAADAAGVEVPGSRDASTEPGSGVRATVDGARVFVGHREWVEQQLREVSGSGHTDGHSSDRTHSHLSASTSTAPSRTGDEAEQGMSMVHVAVEGRGLVGSLAFRDTLRPDARAVVQRLKDLNIRVALLSGDNAATVTAAAQQAGIQADSAWSGMRPEQKAAVVEQLRAGGAVVAMVGDGVNDAPALAAADVGLAMSGGMDAAGEAASVVLLGDRMGQVVEAIVLGRATLGKIRQNLAWALMYNIIGIPLAAGALLPSMGIALNASAAGGMMAFSSLAVVSNSLLLRTHPLGEAADGAAAREPQTRLHSDARQEFGSGGAPAQ